MSASALQAVPHTVSLTAPSSRRRWISWGLSGLAVLFLVFDAGVKLVQAAPAVEATALLGFQPHHLLVLGLIEAACLVLYLVPRTAVLGAVLWTGYFGGAIATHLRLDNPLFTHVLFPIYIAALLWAGLYLRDARVRGLLR